MIIQINKKELLTSSYNNDQRDTRIIPKETCCMTLLKNDVASPQVHLHALTVHLSPIELVNLLVLSLHEE